MSRSSLLGLGLILGLLPSNAQADAPSQPDAGASSTEFFESRVRPLLIDSCVRCHGAKKQSSSLRLDSREAMIKGGDNGPAVVPGKPDESLLVQVVRHAHEDIKMPPKGKLPEPAIGALAQWVADGAPWPKGVVLTAAERDQAAEKHWAFQPVRKVEPAPVAAGSWGTSPVDAFILARLEMEGLRPSGPADKRTLIRRATFDLVGLPPTAAEIDAFEADHSPDAFAKVVDRLLASPRYGERWGRHWLDVARYADTKGYVFTEERRYPYSYTYRDYVIRSFNDDLPYDRFLLEQVAADRLPPGKDTQSLAALGFLTVGRRFLNNQQDIIDDRIDVVTRGLLGLTVSCARCHDHKFDPIPTEDYYSLYGVFASSVEPAELPTITSPEPTPESVAFEKERQARQAKVDEFLASKREEIQEDLRKRIGAYFLAAAELEFNPRHPKLDERARAAMLPPTRLRLAIGRWKAKLDATRAHGDAVLGPWHAFAAIPGQEFSRRAGDVLPALAAKNAPAPNPIVVAEFAASPPASMKDVATRYAELLAKADARPEPKADAASSSADEAAWRSIREWIRADDGPTSLVGEDPARALDRAERNRLKKLTNDVAGLSATHPGAPPRAMVLNDLPQPVEPHVFIRGNPGRPGKPVPRRFLEILSRGERTPFKDGSGRLDLARAIIDPSNPLTARVLVNRVWMLHFGTGLVATPSDFGLRSDPPSHPELLDYLADEFMRGGWSVKTLHRRIMLSSVYQQKGDNNPASLIRDPMNRLLWRFPRRRLEFEPMRDALLAVAGRLDDTLGGRAVDLTAIPFTTRRTVYGFIDRQNLDGVYRTFDFASPDATSPRRFVTTVPQQALFLMNSPFVIDQARHLASTTDASAAPEARIRELYRRIFGRSPEAFEIAGGLRFVGHQSGDPTPRIEIWQSGFGGVDASTGQVAQFTPFPHWTGSAWQFGPKLPDPQKSYLHLNASGGHVGNDAMHAAIRRWTAPDDAVISIEGVLAHKPMQGDGVRGRIVASRGGTLGDWVAQHADVPTRIARHEVKKGETIDFVVDGRGNAQFDTFQWAPVVRKLAPTTTEWNASTAFQGPAPPPLSPWEQYAQVLLLTNEFMFVD